MANRNDPLLEALMNGKSFTWTIPEGGDLASMRKAVKHGQTLTMSPAADPSNLKIGDLVLVRWHGGTIFHQVGEIEDGSFLIVNSLGKINGWVDGSEILGVVTEVVEPEPRPTLTAMLDSLEISYRELLDLHDDDQDLSWRLLSIPQDLRWYAGRLGEERLDVMPRSNIWSFMQNLWRLVRVTEHAADSEQPPPIQSIIDRGKRCVGSAAKIMMLFEVE